MKLNVCYHKNLLVDNDFGGNTETALRQVQGPAGTDPDGEYGPNPRKGHSPPEQRRPKHLRARA